MMYLVRTDKKITECSSWSQVKKALFEACADWASDENFIATKNRQTVEDLFNLGMNEQDFGDVAQVFRLIADDDKDLFYFDCCSPQDTFICKRIL